MKTIVLVALLLTIGLVVVTSAPSSMEGFRKFGDDVALGFKDLGDGLSQEFEVRPSE